MSSTTDPQPARPAATVVVVREHDGQLQVLLLKRSEVGAFAGNWVFPGGRIDDADEGADELARSRSAAVRETYEEVGLTVHADQLVTVSHWTPPLNAPKRFTTWFFLALWNGDEVNIDRHEIVESRWMSGAEALRLNLPMAPPTYVTVTTLAQAETFTHAQELFAQRGVERYVTVPVRHPDGLMLLWHGDAGYACGDVTIDGPRHRMLIVHGATTHYERTE